MVLDGNEIEILTQRFLPLFHRSILTAKYDIMDILNNPKITEALKGIHVTNLRKNLSRDIDGETKIIMKDFGVYDTYKECKAEINNILQEAYDNSSQGTLNEEKIENSIKKLDEIKTKLTKTIKIQIAKRLGKNLGKEMVFFIPLLVAVITFGNFYAEILDNFRREHIKKKKDLLPKWEKS